MLDLLQQMPGVHQITSSGPEAAHVQIIHLLDWHFLTLDRFAVAEQARTGNDFTGDDLLAAYADFQVDLDAIQTEQGHFLQVLIKQCGLQAVYLEGLTPETRLGYLKNLQTLKELQQCGPSPGQQHTLDLARRQVGAAGQMFMAGELRDILPTEDAEAFRTADPVQPDGMLKVDRQAGERREDAIVRSLLQSPGNLKVIVLGGDHDLTDNLQQLAQPVRYIRVMLKAYSQAASNGE